MPTWRRAARTALFTIAKLTGQFYGGAVDFNGTSTPPRTRWRVDLKGSLQGIYLGEMLRGTAGTNSFGNDNLTVSVDGKINVMDISVQGSGRTPQEIRNSLSGRGQVSGALYPTVAKGSLGLASFATGVGSIFSTEMGFGSAVLSGLRQPSEQHRGRGHARQRHGVAQQSHGAGPERRGQDHQPHQPGGGHHRHDHRARHRQARPGRLCGDGEGAGLLADHEHARRQQLALLPMRGAGNPQSREHMSAIPEKTRPTRHGPPPDGGTRRRGS